MPINKTKNEHFFEKWTPEMAYVLGFFAADGYMIKNNRGAWFVDFYSNDRDILEKIRSIIDSNHKISERKRTLLGQNSYRLQIGCKQWFVDLTGHGLMQNKSLRLKFPIVPKKFLCHFIRGYFDGDGSVWAGMMHKNDRKNPTRVIFCRFTCGSKKFLDALLQEISKSADLLGGSILFYSGAYRLSFSTSDTLKIYDFMYNMAGDLYLARKKAVFEKFIGETGKFKISAGVV